MPPGQAIRILTGAILPAGVDTVVLEEDCSITPHAIAFNGPVKPGANARAAGEDFQAGRDAPARGPPPPPAQIWRFWPPPAWTGRRSMGN